MMATESVARWIIRISLYAAIIGLTSGQAQQVRIIRPGDVPNPAAEQMLRDKCEREWPTDFNMRVYCEKKQREAFQALQSGPPPEITGENSAIVRRKCEAEWPNDFNMRAYCEKQQRDGLQKLQAGSPPDIDSQKFEIVRRKCTAEWPVDFNMRAYCEKQQYEAIRKLGGR